MYNTNPVAPDSDEDGASDYEEIFVLNDPNSEDTTRMVFGWR